MPITTIDPKTALVVIDLQKGIRLIPGTEPVIEQAARLVGAFRELGLPVVLVNVMGSRVSSRTDAGGSISLANLPADFADFVPELDVQPTDIIVTKYTWGAFHNTDLDTRLKEHGVSQIVLAGVATSAGVESTARAAHEHGYHVTFATDAMTDRSAEAHENSLKRIFPRLGETGTTEEVLTVLRASHQSDQ